MPLICSSTRFGLGITEACQHSSVFQARTIGIGLRVCDGFHCMKPSINDQLDISCRQSGNTLQPHSTSVIAVPVTPKTLTPHLKGGYGCRSTGTRKAAFIEFILIFRVNRHDDDSLC